MCAWLHWLPGLPVVFSSRAMAYKGICRPVCWACVSSGRTAQSSALYPEARGKKRADRRLIIAIYLALVEKRKRSRMENKYLYWLLNKEKRIKNR